MDWIIRIFNRWIKLNTEGKMRCKFLVWLVVAESSALFLLNRFCYSNLGFLVKQLLCDGFCNYPYLEEAAKKTTNISLAVLVIFFISLFSLININATSKNNGYVFTLNAKSAAKLFASAIQPRFINVSFLIVFVVNVGCVGDIIYSLFSSDAVNGLFYNLFFFIIILVVCAFLIYSFPRLEKKTKNGNNIFFSGISYLSFERNGVNFKIEELNLIPLVRAFYVISEKKEIVRITQGDKVHILLTDAIDSGKLLNAFNSANNEFFSANNELKKDAVKQFNEEFNRIKSNFTTACKVEDVLKDLIKMIGKYEFFEDNSICEIIGNIEIAFTPPANYNNFDDCFGKAKIEMDKYEKNDYSIIINITPGTAIASSALTILSMESGRKLLYHPQSENTKYKMKQIMENKLDFKELIEKIAEQLSDDDND